jgi:RNA polymerase sigma-70 factor (ECF subfamily)
MHTTQADLLKAIRESRNRDDWGAFYRIYAPMVSGFMRRLGLSPTDAEDVCQEVLMIAHRSVQDGSFDPHRGRFRAWLYGIARRQACAARRARHRPTRAQAVAHDGGVDLLGNLEDKSDEAEREIWEQEWRYALLDAAFRALQPQFGNKALRAFELYGIQRLPVEQVAADLGISPASVYAYKHRVLAAIKQWVADYERGEGESQ